MHQESFGYLNELRKLSTDAFFNEFMAEEHPLNHMRHFLVNQGRIELYCVDAVTEDYILQKRLGVGKQMNLIMDGRNRSLRGVADIGGFFMDEKTPRECIETLKQQGTHLLQRSLDYVDRWESYAAMFNALPVFRPAAA